MAHPVIHFEIPAQDLNRLRQFYSDLFGWDMQAPPGTSDYVMINAPTEGPGIGGMIMKKQAPQQTITNYVSVESVAEYCEKVAQLGGQVVKGKTAVPGMGYFAVCLDPEGNPVGLWQDDPKAA